MTVLDAKELRSFLSGYFHEDWALDASRPDDVVAQFLTSRPPAFEVDRIVAQISDYLTSRKEEEAVERGLFEELGCYYLPSADGLSARDWLHHVVQLLRK
jgi:hypothetical protein